MGASAKASVTPISIDTFGQTNASRGKSDGRGRTDGRTECVTTLFMRACGVRRRRRRRSGRRRRRRRGAARAFLLKLSAPEIPRLSLAHGRAESKKRIGPRGKKEGRERRERRGKEPGGGGGGGGGGTAISPPPPSPPPPTTRKKLPPTVKAAAATAHPHPRPWPSPPSSSRAPSDSDTTDRCPRTNEQGTCGRRAPTTRWSDGVMDGRRDGGTGGRRPMAQFGFGNPTILSSSVSSFLPRPPEQNSQFPSLQPRSRSARIFSHHGPCLPDCHD